MRGDLPYASNQTGRVASTYIGTDRPWGSGSLAISIATFQQSSNKRPHLIHSGGPLLRPGLSHRKSPDGNVRAIRARLGEGCRRREEARQQAKGSMPNMLNVWQWPQLAH